MTLRDRQDIPDVIHNEAAQKFELHIGDAVCLVQYRIKDGRMIIYHSEVPPPLERNGLAARMTRAALQYARAQKLLVEPRCPYTAAFFRKHPEYADLLG
jgi:predicted GNAT family acetyltransferase